MRRVSHHAVAAQPAAANPTANIHRQGQETVLTELRRLNGVFGQMHGNQDYLGHALVGVRHRSDDTRGCINQLGGIHNHSLR
ncbi:hypothetical protein FOA52_011308 [Chlamydomonas sp. UWO 241]|nr:hypothetical protein FOA52_011308 [Chlamydomonas sp. UWO 241]